MTLRIPTASLPFTSPPREISLRLEGGALPLWAILRPVDLTLTHGINITEERLQELAESYDPEAVEVAPINFDHDYGGPAHGWIRSLEVRDGLLLAEPMDLSEELIQGLRERRYRRQSVEINLEHQITGGWYLEGLAVLGNAKPAVKALPPLTLTARPRWVLAPGKEETVSDNDESGTPPAPPPPVPESPEATPEPEPSRQPPELPRAALAAERLRLREETDALRRERLTARRERLQGEVQRQVGELGSRITPAMRRAGLEELLTALRAQDEPTRVSLAAEGEAPRESDAADLLLAVLAALPEFTALGAGAMAGEDGDAPRAQDQRTTEQRALDGRHGISDERALELQRKYPGAFGPH